MRMGMREVGSLPPLKRYRTTLSSRYTSSFGVQPKSTSGTLRSVFRPAASFWLKRSASSTTACGWNLMAVVMGSASLAGLGTGGLDDRRHAAAALAAAGGTPCVLLRAGSRGGRGGRVHQP